MTELEKQAQYKDFIGYYRNVYPQGYCQHLIDEFERLAHEGAGSNRRDSENAPGHIKDDYQIMVNIRNHNLLHFQEKNSCTLFFDGLQDCFTNYETRYSVIKQTGMMRGTVMKMQRTGPGGGYHIWHSEQGSGDSANRVLVYLLYLNSFEDADGGETEFLYQRERIKPEENLMLIWPAAFTHPHRGNPVLTEKYKYIVTGWFYYD